MPGLLQSPYRRGITGDGIDHVRRRRDGSEAAGLGMPEQVVGRNRFKVPEQLYGSAELIRSRPSDSEDVLQLSGLIPLAPSGAMHADWTRAEGPMSVGMRSKSGCHAL